MSVVILGLHWLFVRGMFKKEINVLIHMLYKKKCKVTFYFYSLPYLEAFLMEVQRKASILPVLPHFAIRDIEFQGYHIPKVKAINMRY
jgi:cytochrome P450